MPSPVPTKRFVLNTRFKPAGAGRRGSASFGPEGRHLRPVSASQERGSASIVFTPGPVFVWESRQGAPYSQQTDFFPLGLVRPVFRRKRFPFSNHPWECPRFVLRFRRSASIPGPSSNEALRSKTATGPGPNPRRQRERSAQLDDRGGVSERSASTGGIRRKRFVLARQKIPDLDSFAAGGEALPPGTVKPRRPGRG